MSGSAPPEDKSVQLAQMEQQQTREATAAQAVKDKQQRDQFTGNVSNAYSGAMDTAKQYFTSRGLDPNDYITDINSTLTSDRNKVPDLSATPGQYFDGAGQTAYNNARDAKRGTLNRQVGQYAPAGFETRSIGDTTDDATLAAILAEQRQTADNYVKNLLDRGVINQSGYTAAGNDLTGQSAGANARLQEIGNQVIQGGRTKVSNIANDARRGAANYELGDNFDPFSYSTDINSALGDFFGGLGANIRGKVPTGLFSTAGLSNIAGAAQGAQNLPFSPAALAGNSTKDEEKAAATSSFINAF